MLLLWRTPSTTVDHVPSRQMFVSRLRPKGLEVPARRDCNQANRNHEQVAAMLGRFYPDPNTTAERAEVERIVRAVKNNFPGLLEEMRPTQRQRHRFEQAREFRPIDSNPISCNGPLLNRSIQIFGAKLGFALHYDTTRRIIPSEGGAAVRWYSNFEAITGNLPSDMLNILGPPETLRQGKWHTANQFEYSYAHADNLRMGIYFSTFRKSFAVASFVSDNASKFGGLNKREFHQPWPPMR